MWVVKFTTIIPNTKILVQKCKHKKLRSKYISYNARPRQVQAKLLSVEAISGQRHQTDRAKPNQKPRRSLTPELSYVYFAVHGNVIKLFLIASVRNIFLINLSKKTNHRVGPPSAGGKKKVRHRRRRRHRQFPSSALDTYPRMSHPSNQSSKKEIDPYNQQATTATKNKKKTGKTYFLDGI